MKFKYTWMMIFSVILIMLTFIVLSVNMEQYEGYDAEKMMLRVCIVLSSFLLLMIGCYSAMKMAKEEEASKFNSTTKLEDKQNGNIR